MGFGEKGKAGGRNPPQVDITVIQMRVNGTLDQDGCRRTSEK